MPLYLTLEDYVNQFCKDWMNSQGVYSAIFNGDTLVLYSFKYQNCKILAKYTTGSIHAFYFLRSWVLDLTEFILFQW